MANITDKFDHVSDDELFEYHRSYLEMMKLHNDDESYWKSMLDAIEEEAELRGLKPTPTNDYEDGPSY